MSAFNIGLSGLRAASTDLGVTGNNVANSSTVGFKNSRAEFADVFSQGYGGIQQTAVGAGARVASVTQQFAQGTIEYTDNSLDLAISGQGFFVLDDNGSQVYSRAGAFQVDRNGFVVNSGGQKLQVYSPQTTGIADPAFNTGQLVSDLQLQTGESPPLATSEISAIINLRSDAQPPAATFAFSDPLDPSASLQPDPDSYNFSTSLMVYDSLGTPRTATMYFAQVGYAADSFVDDPDSTDDPPAQLRVIDPIFESDPILGYNVPETDAAYNADQDAAAIAGRAALAGKPVPLTWNVYVGMEDADGYVQNAAAPVGAQTVVFDADGNLLSVNGVGDPTAGIPPGSIDVQFPITLLFNPDGTPVNVPELDANGDPVVDAAGDPVYVQELDVNGDPVVDAAGDPVYVQAKGPGPFPNGALPLTVPINLTGTTQFGQQYTVNDLKQDGFTTGRLDGIDVDETGVVFARFTNGRSEALGQVALANFANPQGLQKLGDSTWAESFSSGDVRMGWPGTADLGLIQAGGLESSNVDLAEQLVKLITAQRNYQANAQTISAADTITQTIINI